jgi:methylenetetrahydrofolate dehydrogenase (NADP+) / methenyltetrahydrofolate cyclohydrolase
MTLFDGYEFAAEKERALQERVTSLRQQGKQIAVAAILFVEDKGSQLYTGLKQQAAERIGVDYQIHSFSMKDPLEKIQATINELNADQAITGIIIQKPWRQNWETVTGQNIFAQWWHDLVSHIAIQKDVDGLHPETLEAVKQGVWYEEGKVLPATVKAVLSILESAQLLKSAKYLVIGKSDILGRPLAYELQNLGFQVELLGKKDLAQRMQSGQRITDADVIVSATGQLHLVTGDMIKPGAAVVDVGEPRPDVERESVEKVASFLTPVPGGVGPVTVISLLENAVELVEK